eukprot:m.157616 g.157616  ORF g.157616 m.157616 type:complete len:128 (+) comp17974_c0_seq3:49-432(+)
MQQTTARYIDGAVTSTPDLRLGDCAHATAHLGGPPSVGVWTRLLQLSIRCSGVRLHSAMYTLCAAYSKDIRTRKSHHDIAYLATLSSIVAGGSKGKKTHTRNINRPRLQTIQKMYAKTSTKHYLLQL